VTGAVDVFLGLPERKPLWNNPASASFSSEANFDQWFRSVPSVNFLVAPFSISPTSGSWTYPIDGLGFGNEGETHNYLFTCEIHTEFIYTGSGDWMLQIGSDDDAWAFVDGSLVLDNGGVHAYRIENGVEPAGLVLNETYTLDIFFAERHLTKSRFTIDSSLCITCAAGFYDACGICGGDNSTCIGCDGVPNSGLVIDRCGVCGGDGMCTQPSPPPSPSSPPHPPCSSGNCPPIKDYTKVNINATCQLERIDHGRYRFIFGVDEAESRDQQAALASLAPYNQDIRTRDACDSRLSLGPGLDWAEDGPLGVWGLDQHVHAPEWTDVVTGDPGSQHARYSRVFTLDDLLACPNSGIVSEQIPYTSAIRHSGMWHLIHTTPTDTDNENAGEDVLYEKECSFQIHEGQSGVDTITIEVESLHFEVHWVKTFCCAPDGYISVLLRTCISHPGYEPGCGSFLRPCDEGEGPVWSKHTPAGTYSLKRRGGHGCDARFDDKCCQTWELKGLTEDAVPPLDDFLKLFFTAQVEHRMHPAALIAKLGLHVDDICRDPSLYVNDTACGDVVLYRDTTLMHPYQVAHSPPFLDCDRMYARLELCQPLPDAQLTGARFTKILLEYEEAGGNGTIIERVIYERLANGSIITDEYFDVESESSEPTLVPVLSWLARGLGAEDAVLQVVVHWELYPLSNGGGGPNPFVAMPARLTAHGQRQAALLGPHAQSIFQSNNNKNNNMATLDGYIEEASNGEQSEQVIAVRCNPRQKWDGRKGRCWDKEHKDDWHVPIAHEQVLLSWWLMLAVFLVMLLVLSCLCCCGSSRARSSNSCFRRTCFGGPGKQHVISADGTAAHHHHHHNHHHHDHGNQHVSSCPVVTRHAPVRYCTCQPTEVVDRSGRLQYCRAAAW